jgi:sulfite dehydrogenase (cytochrome) subunit B
MKALLLVLAGTCLSFPAHSDETALQLHDAPDRELVVARCSVCHSVDYVPMNAPVFDRGGWQKSVRKMIDTFGAPISEDDAKRIVEYLGSHY